MRILAIAFAASVLFASACAADETPLPACPEAAVIKAELGLDVGEPETSDGDQRRFCKYQPASKNGKDFAQIAFEAWNAADFAMAKENAAGVSDFSDLAGLGDSAYYFSTTGAPGTRTMYSVFAHKGTLQIYLNSYADLGRSTAFITKLFG